MYDAYFELADRPFQLTPDPKFWFDTATHKKAMAYLGYGLAQGEGFIVITGDIGAGKTTLLGHLMENIDPANLNVIKIVSTAIEADDLLRIVAAGLGVDAAGKSKAELLLAIERGLHAVARTGRRTLLIVDESQALATSALEELRMLSNFQAGGHAMLQIFLLGQPEFRERLNGSDRLEQLRQRVIAVHHLDPMGRDEVASYIAHRLAVAGAKGRPAFTDDAYPALYRASAGVPRRLNQLMSRVLLHAAVSECDVIDGRMVRAVVDDQRRELPVQAPAATVAPVAPPVAAAAPEPVPMPTPVAQAQPESVAEAEPAAMPEPVAVTQPMTVPHLVHIAPEPAAAPVEPDRLAALEARIAEQDETLRRMLTLLVDWVENDGTKAESLKGAA